MAGIETFDFDSPDETRTPDKTRVDVVHTGGTTAARFAFDPGWRWSECVKPVAGTDSCQARHVGRAGHPVRDRWRLFHPAKSHFQGLLPTQHA